MVTKFRILHDGFLKKSRSPSKIVFICIKLLLYGGKRFKNLKKWSSRTAHDDATLKMKNREPNSLRVGFLRFIRVQRSCYYY